MRWVDKAACVGEDPMIFHRLSNGDPGTEGMNEAEIKKLEISNFEKARKICKTCPVTAECAVEGQRISTDITEHFDSGNKYSIWGGENPVGWSHRRKGRPPLKTADPNGVCGYGHVGRLAIQGKEVRCRECKAEAKRNEYAKKLAAAGKTRRMTLKERHEKGEFNHTFEPGSNTERYRCLICERNRWAETSAKRGTVRVDIEEAHALGRYGHAFELVMQGSTRRCRACRRISNRKYKAAKREAVVQ
jgi:hypothetical protein